MDEQNYTATVCSVLTYVYSMLYTDTLGTAPIQQQSMLLRRSSYIYDIMNIIQL